MYNADMEYLLDWRADREPSCDDDIVFCREIGWKEDEEAVEAREGVCNMTDIPSEQTLDSGGTISTDLAVQSVGPTECTAPQTTTGVGEWYTARGRIPRVEHCQFSSMYPRRSSSIVNAIIEKVSPSSKAKR